jgi:hypothetical protein
MVSPNVIHGLRGASLKSKHSSGDFIMRSIQFHRWSFLPLAALVFSGSLLFAAPAVVGVGPPVVESVVPESAARVSQLLEEVRSIAYDLRRDAATLESYKLSNLGWHTHANQLNMAKQHINAIGDRLEKLQALRGSAAPWQQQAIDAIIPVAEEMASRTDAAIRHVNDNPKHLYAPHYTDTLSTIADNAGEMKQSLTNYLDFASTQEKLENLRERISASNLAS